MTYEEGARTYQAVKYRGIAGIVATGIALWGGQYYFIGFSTFSITVDSCVSIYMLYCIGTIMKLIRDDRRRTEEAIRELRRASGRGP